MRKIPGKVEPFGHTERAASDLTDMETTRLSTKGQIVLPKSLRTERAWEPGTEFTVEETCDGILLRPAALFRVHRSH
jgi:AbrB family looped-hinge helix DNA binding protein